MADKRIDPDFNRHAFVRSGGTFNIYSSREEAQAAVARNPGTRYMYLSRAHIGQQWSDEPCDCEACENQQRLEKPSRP